MPAVVYTIVLLVVYKERKTKMKSLRPKILELTRRGSSWRQ